MADLPTKLSGFPNLRFPSWEDLDEWRTSLAGMMGGLSVSEDDKNVYVEADIPGINPEDVDVTFEKGILWIRAEEKEVKTEKRKYYRKASRSYSYRIKVPDDVDTNVEPEVTYDKGTLIVKFAKSPTSQPKKLPVKLVK